jgi:hypothetical protein
MLLAALPILVELFTSEGCSSCPPADAVVARLHEAQPVSGVDLVVLSEHVDYWDNLGWRDPFSQHLFTERQGRYGSRIYTPQAIVDGRIDVLGSDDAGIQRAAKSAAAEPHGSVLLARDGPSNVDVSVSALPKHGPAEVLLALVEDGLVSKVAKGENAGRTLRHTAVVRQLTRIGSIAPDEPGFRGSVKAFETTAKGKLRAIVFVQEEKGARVLAAGSL